MKIARRTSVFMPFFAALEHSIYNMVRSARPKASGSIQGHNIPGA
jgi:hypothetical protein